MADIPLNALADELLKMAQTDQEMRTRIQKDMGERDDHIDRTNTARLKELIRAHE